MKEKVVLAYSGGLDTSVTIPWLKDNYDVEVIAVCVNVGQEDDMDKVKEKAVNSGAAKIYVEDVKEEFVTEYLYNAIKWNATYEGKYLLGTSFARPLIAKKLVEVAHKEGAKYICHGCTGKGNDQVRFETAIAAMDPYIKIIAPWRLWNIDSREAEIDYALSKGVEVPVTKEKIYSEDWNLWHISHEGGDLEDPKNEHKEEMYKCVTPPEEAKDEPAYISIYFEKGVPCKINGEELEPVKLIEKVNKVAGENGIGVVDLVENRLVGMKSRGVYETPGGTLLYEAHAQLERLTVDKDAYHYKQVLALKYSELVYDGLWFTTTREALDAFVDTVEENVTGTVKLKLYKGNMKVSSVESENALYDEGISSFGASDLYDHKDAQGFINLFSLPSKIKAMKKLEKK
ncbi:argininosuccinate synthase [Clostridium acetobutylicum]|jgi:argininosuccinate synthase|uniref:Argininosuccinate synthase n=1 Tax=Clostridium acetobutylicum (strain ATCC 824 / DSM 792 / JCM 1419 / IAM 19013 / LMG 5710 / NBRC 13948 / NRRL B-527 / VKM B-1787 / 2291 / W) TaxID=272562 RepID=ASSY_CLOAB|nr:MULTISPECIES: argininosuccinate synthase [Clostridium]Q97KE6.1 RecName: Full=Argininosuccinate synthase; AltName: Full=Citrulline--aspartate ligase [Clostridium acetobutylicum ATCC 824]AAK78949.1 Argininosuccinate synthase [Clostridium acetobutylicum ATCC 824]ADZ20023.1 argininosuccinate synthase [Clostridium acetobutylicum EA 2018]AEI33227.1 argininosuccinate synthase [Clostridium acetobutylicum DSM 1731]AWV81794.1 argininosuccinate synthase [Clostridium acetobutylicum]MBC2395338.1 argini